MPLMLADHVGDPKQETSERIGSLDGVTVTRAQVLVAIYKRPERTKGGLVLPDSVRDEDKFQGKVGLVLAVGPDAFVDDDRVHFGVKPKIGDWVVFKVSDGWPLRINNDRADCRILDDVDVRLVVDQPDRVF